jgi:hypothetical protein
MKRAEGCSAHSERWRAEAFFTRVTIIVNFREDGGHGKKTITSLENGWTPQPGAQQVKDLAKKTWMICYSMNEMTKRYHRGENIVMNARVEWNG